MKKGLAFLEDSKADCGSESAAANCSDWEPTGKWTRLAIGILSVPLEAPDGTFRHLREGAFGPVRNGKREPCKVVERLQVPDIVNHKIVPRRQQKHLDAAK